MRSIRIMKWDYYGISLEFWNVWNNFDISHQSHMTLILVIITLKTGKIRDENWLFRKFGEFNLKAKLELEIRQINVPFKNEIVKFAEFFVKMLFDTTSLVSRKNWQMNIFLYFCSTVFSNFLQIFQRLLPN